MVMEREQELNKKIMPKIVKSFFSFIRILIQAVNEWPQTMFYRGLFLGCFTTFLDRNLQQKQL